jgi:hypothetical protein
MNQKHIYILQAEIETWNLYIPIMSLNQYTRYSCKLLNIMPLPVSRLPGQLWMAPKDMKCLQWGWQTR